MFKYRRMCRRFRVGVIGLEFLTDLSGIREVVAEEIRVSGRQSRSQEAQLLTQLRD